MKSYALFKLDTILSAVAALDTKLDTVGQLSTQLETFMATMQQVLDDLALIKQRTGDYIAKRDQIDVDLQKQVSDLIAQHVTDTAAANAAQTAIDAAFAAAEQDKDLLSPPVVVTPLASSFPDNASFTSAVAAYTGPEAVTLDGKPTAKTGTPTLAYFTHSTSTPPGAIDTTGPTS